ncbi:MAG: hypothetical protein QXG35_06510 [Nitrososphaerota archaeon]
MKIEVLVTRPEIIGRGIRGIEPVIEEIINGASSEIHVATHLLTSSAIKIIELLLRTAEGG